MAHSRFFIDPKFRPKTDRVRQSALFGIAAVLALTKMLARGCKALRQLPLIITDSSTKNKCFLSSRKVSDIGSRCFNMRPCSMHAITGTISSPLRLCIARSQTQTHGSNATCNAPELRIFDHAKDNVHLRH